MVRPAVLLRCLKVSIKGKDTAIWIASKIVVYEEGERRPSPVLECRIDQETTERKDDGPLQQDNPEQL